MKSTVVLIVSHDLSFPDEQCVILVQSSNMLPCGYKPFAEFVAVSSLGRGQDSCGNGKYQCLWPCEWFSVLPEVTRQGLSLHEGCKLLLGLDGTQTCLFWTAECFES